MNTGYEMTPDQLVAMDRWLDEKLDERLTRQMDQIRQMLSDRLDSRIDQVQKSRSTSRMDEANVSGSVSQRSSNHSEERPMRYSTLWRILGGLFLLGMAITGYFAFRIDNLDDQISQVSTDLAVFSGVVDKQFEAVDLRFDMMEETMGVRFDAMDERFRTIDTRFDAMDERLDAIEVRFDRLETILTDPARQN